MKKPVLRNRNLNCGGMSRFRVGFVQFVDKPTCLGIIWVDFTSMISGLSGLVPPGLTSEKCTEVDPGSGIGRGCLDCGTKARFGLSSVAFSRCEITHLVLSFGQ